MNQKEIERRAHRLAVLARLHARIAELKAEPWTAYNEVVLRQFEILARQQKAELIRTK